MNLSTLNFSDETNIVPDVPSEMLHLPSPVVAVPTAAAALSPAPATTIALLLIPNSLYCIFEFCSKSYAVLVSTVIELVSLIVSIITEEIIRRKAKNLSKIEENKENNINV